MTKGRPRGYRLDRAALDALLEERRLSMTEGAEVFGLTLKRLSALANGGRASIKTVRSIEGRLGINAGKLFPELSDDEPTGVAS